MSGGLTVLADTPRFQRKMRRPRHDFNVRHMPFCITPFAIAPVLPGETLKDGNLQSRAVVDPIRNPLIGWWLEHYVFYVKHSHLPGADTFKDMMINPAAVTSGQADATTSSIWYHPGSGINWVKQCIIAVTEAYFRDEGDL